MNAPMSSSISTSMSPPPASADVYAKTALPETGLRNYWYPVLAAWRLRKKPRAVKILGEDIVLFRNGGKIYALQDRCPHRGAKLSQGACLYPGSGSLSCPYHGWTFDGTSGRVVAKLMEGPEAIIPPTAAVKSYPIKEYRSVLWIFVGDMEAVALEEDLPDCMLPDWHGFSTWRTYNCNWRVLKDNLCHDLHAPFVHRKAPELILQPIFPYAVQLAAEPLSNGKGLGYSARGGISVSEFPGLGRFPPARETWYRRLKPTGRGKDLDPAKSPAVVKYGIHHRQMSMLPGITLVGRPSGDYFIARWVVPIDADTTLFYSFSMYRRSGAWATLRQRLQWIFWLSWAHDWLFSDQDKRILEHVETSKEMLSRTDSGVVAWRRFASEHARRPPTDQQSDHQSDQRAADE
jgi:phenylpropionate dioxygenase-like ring-hydroxylating dioxygenase large terminal subunit